MTPEDLLTRAADQLSVRRVFGEPVEHDGILMIPVAMAVGGGGGGSGPHDQGAGGSGFGGVVRGIGVYSITNGQVRFIPRARHHRHSPPSPCSSAGPCSARAGDAACVTDATISVVAANR